MPQMSPMWWTFMMLVFIILFVMIMTMLYFNLTNKMEKNIETKIYKINWKW